jgi:hypothetical protein
VKILLHQVPGHPGHVHLAPFRGQCLILQHK